MAMRSHHFFIEQKIKTGLEANGEIAEKTIRKIAGKIKIENDELVHQWRNVLRFQVGQEVILFDNSGWEFRGVIVSLGNRSAEVKLLESRLVGFAPKFSVFLYVALTKRNSFEWTLEKGTELGVMGFVPTISERSEKKNINIDRSKNILKEASEQSGRVILPEIFEPASLAESLENLFPENHLPGKSVGISFVLDPDGTQFEAAKCKEYKNGGRVNVFIGPEGGFSPREIELFRKRDIPIYSIGEQVLRAETAAVAISSILLAIS